MADLRASEVSAVDRVKIKFIMIGNASVGKTSLMTRYFDDSWGADNLPPTLGV
jgi:GTPase SAR1 family protein